MTLNVAPPYSFIPDLEGDALENGQIYIGTANLNPLIEANRIALFSDVALSAPIAQPVRTSGGLPINNNGSPTQIFVAGTSYSIVVLDRNGALVWSNLNVTSIQNTVDWTNIVYTRSAIEIAAAAVPSALYYYYGNALRFGADPSGVADSTLALQTAINTHAGASIYIPAGTYKCTAMITVPANTTIYGDGMGLTTLTFNNCDANQIIFAGGKVTLRDLTVTVTGVGVSSNIAAVNISNVDYCKVQRLEVTGVCWAGVGIFLNASHNIVEGCYFHSWQGTVQDSADVCLSYLTGNTDYNIVRDNICLGGGENGVMILGTAGANPQYNLIAGNRIGNHTTYGIVDYRSANGLDGFNQHVDNYIENIQGTTRPGGGVSASGAGIYILSSGGALVKGNTVRNCCVQTTIRSLSPAAIAVTGIGDPVAMMPVNVIGNVIDQMTKWDGILIADCPSGANVVGNTVRMPANTTGEAAINIAACSNVVCSSNSIEISPTAGTTVCGITVSMVAPLTDQRNIVITDNRIIGGNSKAIRVTSSGAYTLTNLVIANNTINNSGGGDDCIILGAKVTNGTITGNVVNWTTNKCLVISDTATRVRVANNVFQTTGADSFYSAVACVSCYFDKTNFCSGNYLNTSTGWITERLGNAAPAAGNGAVGDRVEQSVPVVGQPKGWRCTVAGAPGTWVSEGNL